MFFVATIASTNAQYGNRTYGDDSYGNQGYNNYNDDRYYYDEEFDWHWDVRVRISNGIQTGQITQWEANRLYRRLESVERKEYAYQADGIYTSWEQQEVWDDITYLNRQVGIELYDFDRSFYGFNNWGYDFRGYNRWFYQGGYDFYRFDRRGFGSIRLGYATRPNYNGWYRNNNNQIGRNHFEERSRNYSNNSRGNDRNGYDKNRNSNDNRTGNSRGSYDNNRNSQSNGNERNSGGSYGTDRNTNPSGGYSRGNADNSRNQQSPSSDYGRNSQGNGTTGSETPRRSRPDVNVEPNRSDNFSRGSGVQTSRTERQSFPQEGNGRVSRGGSSDSQPSVERPSRSERSSESAGQSRGSDSPRSNDSSEKRGRRNEF